jgi:mono/diheme cytochrome c family protein
MTRSVLQPIRSRRLVRTSPQALRNESGVKNTSPTPATRQTLAAIGALWVSFAVTSSANPVPVTPVTDTAPNKSMVSLTAPAPESVIERGRYLVESVGMCADCHAPRTEKGELDRSRWLLGSALGFQPTAPMPWAPAAPPIAGLPSVSDAQGVVFLTTGKRPDGSAPRPPMPEYRLNKMDATAVIAYLKSLSK